MECSKLINFVPEMLIRILDPTVYHQHTKTLYKQDFESFINYLFLPHLLHLQLI